MKKSGAKRLKGYKLAAKPTVCKSTSDQLKIIVSICLYHKFLATNSRQTHRAPEDDLGILGHELLPVARVDAWAAADAHGQVGKDEKHIPTTVSIDCSKGLSWTYMFLHVLPPTIWQIQQFLHMLAASSIQFWKILVAVEI